MQVSGRMLLAMTDTLLIELGVKNASHRLAIKFAIEDLQAASGTAAVDRAAAGARLLLLCGNPSMCSCHTEEPVELILRNC